jgi:hypothetical protein
VVPDRVQIDTTLNRQNPVQNHAVTGRRSGLNRTAVKMSFEWDEAKRLSNIEERGVDFRDAALIFEGAVIAKEDTREDYGE